MTQELLRDATNINEINKVLAELAEENEVLLAWQNQGDERYVENVYFKDFNHHTGLLSVGCADKSKDLTFKSGTEVFFRHDQKKMLFRAKISVISKKLIEAKIPASIKLPDRRSVERKNFKVTHDQSNGMLMIFQIYSQVDQVIKEFECELFDFSTQGAGIRARQKIMKHFKVGDVIKIKTVKDQELEEPVEARIVYIKEIEEQKKLHHSIFYRLGTSFSKEIILN